MTGGQDPETGVNAAVYVDGVYLGSYDFGAGAQAQTIGARAELSEITLAQGTHSVTFRRLSGGERANNRMMPGCVTFKRIGAARAEANLNFVALWDQNYAQGLTRSPLDATLASDGWQVNQARTAGSLLAGANFSFQNYGLLAAVADQGYPKHAELSLDFQVAEDGVYAAQLIGYQNASIGGTAAVFVDDVYLGSYDFGKAGQGLYGENAELLELPLRAGVHTVSLRRIGGGADRRFLIPNQIRFTAVGEYRAGSFQNFIKAWDGNYQNGTNRTPLDAALASDGWQINQERTAASLLAGNSFSFANYGILAKVADAGYAKHAELAWDFQVEQAGLFAVDFTGRQEAASGGLATLYVDGTYLGTYDFGADCADLFGETMRMANISLEEGTHTAILRRTGGGSTHTALLPASLNFRPIGEPRAECSVDFRCADDEAYLSSPGATPLDATMESHGWTIDREASAASVSTTLPPAYLRSGIVVQVADAGLPVHADLAVRFQVKAAADYRLSFNGGQYADGAEADILLDGVQVGEYSFAGDGSRMVGESVDLGEHSLAQGEHVLILRRQGGSANERLYPGALRLEEVRADTAARLEVSAEELATVSLGGEKRTAVAAQRGGEPVDLRRAQLRAISADAQVATASVAARPDGSAELVVTGAALGSTTITLMAVESGQIDGITVPVTVAEGGAFRGVTLTLGQKALQVGETTRAQVRAETMDGSAISLEGEDIYYRSSDARVASVDNQGVVRAKAQGQAEITVYVTIDGALRQASAALSVTDPAELASVRLESPGALTVGDRVQLQVSGTLESGNPADLSEADVTYTLESAAPDGAVSLTAEGLLTASAPGAAQVSASVTLAGVTLRAPAIRITVADTGDQPLSFNFRTKQQGSPLDATFDSHGFQINREKSEEQISVHDYFQYQTYGLYVRVWGLGTPKTADFAIDIRVPKAGNYAFDLEYLRGASGGLAQVYLDEQYMDTVDFYSNDNIQTSRRLKSLYLSAGEHTVTFRRINWAQGPQHDAILEHIGNYNHLYISALVFTPIAGLPEIQSLSLEPGQTVLSAGESTVLDAVVQMADGTTYAFGPTLSGGADPENSLQYQSLTPEILAVDAAGRVRALAPGQGQIQATAQVGESLRSESCTLTVDSQRLHAVSVALKKQPLIRSEAVPLVICAQLEDGREIKREDLTLSCISDKPEILRIDSVEGGYQAYGVSAGSATVTVTAALDGTQVTGVLDVAVSNDGFSVVEVRADTTFLKPTSAGTQLHVSGKTHLGQAVDLAGAEIQYRNQNPEVVSVSEGGYVTPVAPGSAEIFVDVTAGGVTRTGQITLYIREGKVEATYFTEEKVQAARENAKALDWARTAKNSAVEEAKQYLDMGAETLWNAVTTQELPRGIVVGYRYDPELMYCRYCRTNLQQKYGSAQAWVRTEDYDWKIQCPDCRRKFPSNEFGNFYQLGIDEHGNWSYEQAKAENQKLVEAGQDGYLKNVLYPEMDQKLGVTGWGVDDGYGYRTGHTFSNGIEEVHTYIAYYNHWDLWYGGLIPRALNAMRDAYLYTGESQYGRLGAILLDRIADVYPDMYTAPYFPNFSNSDSTKPHGRITGCIWEHYVTRQFSQAYDAFFPMYSDSQLIGFLRQKAAQYQMENTKDQPELLLDNVEDGILREVYKATVEYDSYGNFGTHQEALALAAVVLDTQPETDEWIEWLFKTGDSEFALYPDGNPGGDINRQLINTVDRDGMGNESSPQYTNLWVNSLQDVADPLAGYVTNPEWDLYQHPKVIKMGTVGFSLVLARKASVQIGDSGRVANTYFDFYEDRLLDFYKHTKDERVGQMLYFLNGNSADGLHYDAFTPDPASLAREIQQVIDTYGEYDFDRSEMLAGYGFSILRGGTYVPAVSALDAVNTQQDAWMYYGNALRHGHLSTLNLGLEAFGLNFAPDNGYPEAADGSDLMLNSNHATLSHNTVVVDDSSQDRISKTGNPLHFDDAGRVKVMDADVPFAYGNTSVYRRSVLMVQATEQVSYYVDFFRIQGGNEHLYSFHALSDEIHAIDERLQFVSQPMGTYAGPDVPWGTPGYSNGYSYFDKVRRAEDPGLQDFFVDFRIKDFRGTLPKKQDLHLRMTMLNDFSLSEVSLVRATPPRVSGNPQNLEYVLARRSGNNLNTLFTTVLEPYEGSRYIRSLEQVSMVPASGDTGSAQAKAVKVTLEDGREDYILYAEDNTVEYLVDGVIRFQGALGVYSRFGGECVYSYLNDGEILGELTGALPAVTGAVESFTKNLSRENSITVAVDQAIDPEALSGQYLYVENDNAQNSVYPILSAARTGDGKLVLDLGETTLIRRYRDSANFDAGYEYNIAEGQRFRIPLPALYDTTPVFTQVQRAVATAGKKFTLQVSAESPVGKALTYEGALLPRGASFDPASRTLTWTPDEAQLGEHPVSITATDGAMTGELLFQIRVNRGSGSGGTTGGQKDDPPSPPVVVDPPEPGDEEDPPAEAPEFTDLAGYEWAAPAIRALAARGIVKGYDGQRFMPGNQVIRADFAALLTRAFALSGSGEPFSDVPADAYYAGELASARGSGIVAGVGDNRFLPQNPITRQDMMLILYRAMNRSGYQLPAGGESTLAAFADGAQVSDYAREAMAALAAAGIVAGDGGRLKPREHASRAEVAVLLARVLGIDTNISEA